ncbi:inositol 1,4,5-trisphosphate receptor-interacting protein-like [Polypterus senegalus]|uniref:inositol 1,4,5-trisphosphate receptor-interacting protein-like n=1 Tax=Polypterus senegalus TaxID=55291 RepID=UPI001966B2CC|nr:inositol 1,4,5-trisphosphate receptor-interacting protein-like [Polypterus senegalus]
MTPPIFIYTSGMSIAVIASTGEITDSANTGHFQGNLTAVSHTPLSGMMSTAEMLEELYQSKVDFNATEFISYKSKAEYVVTILLEEVQKHVKPRDPKIQLKPIGTGSAFEGVKVKPDLEFDFMVPIEITWDQIIFSDKDPNIPVCFGVIQIEIPMSTVIMFQSTSIWAKDLNFKEKFCVPFQRYGHVLSAEKIQRWFQSMCAHTLPELALRFPGINFRFRTSGPARTLVFDWLGKEVNIDIVPAVPYQGVFLVAKMTSHFGEAAWRLSFSTSEKAFFNSLPANSCYFKCLKILKYLRENDKRMCSTSQLSSSCPSFYLKTAFFHQVLQTTEYVWQNHNLEGRVKGLLQYLAECMRQRHLPHIFVGNKVLEGKCESWLWDVPRKFFRFSETNLLKDANKETLDQIRWRLIYIHDHFEEVLQQSHTYSTQFSPRILPPEASTEIRAPTGQVRVERRSYGTAYGAHHSPPTFPGYNYTSQGSFQECCQVLCVVVVLVFLFFFFLIILFSQFQHKRGEKFG